MLALSVDRADKGDYTYVAAFLLPAALFDDSFAEGMHLAVACAERGDTDPTAVDYSQLNPRLAEQERASALAELEICRDWRVALLPREELQLVASDIPVLLLSGEFDPITPPQYASSRTMQLVPCKSKATGSEACMCAAHMTVS